VGERILVLLSAKRLADLVASGRPVSEAAEATLGEVERLGSSAGLIALDDSGQAAILRNTPFMAVARRS
jgi:isoaspartyl peptidase/L-asparaginase-like protein (Ntn-hydrolase superfamily)